MQQMLLRSLALLVALGLATTTDAQTTLFDFEGFGGDVQGWEPDVDPDPDAGAPSEVRTLDVKPIGMGNTINAFEGTYMLEGVPNRPIPAAGFRGMAYEWSSPQDWSGTPILKVAASMYANGPNSELHQFRVRVTDSEGETFERIYDGLKSNQGNATDGDTFVNEWQVLTLDLREFDGVDDIVRLEAAGRHADTKASGGTPVVAEVVDGEIVPIEGANWGGFVHLDLVTVEPPPVSVEGAPGLAELGPVFPNPASGAATIELAVDRAQRVTVTVLDVLGRELSTAFDASVSTGTSVPVALSTADLAPGRYLVRVQGETFTTARPFSVVR